MALIKMASGDNLDIVYTIKDENDAVVNLTGGSIAWTVYRSETTTTVISAKAGALTDPTNGVTTVSLDPADTSSLKGTYTMDGEFTDSGADVYTFESGGLVIE